MASRYAQISMALLQHHESGEVYVAEFADGLVTAICGPLAQSDWHDADTLEPRADWADQPYKYEDEDADWANAQRWQLIATD